MQSGRQATDTQSPREIERQTGIRRSSVQRIAKYDLHLGNAWQELSQSFIDRSINVVQQNGGHTEHLFK